MHLYSFYVLFYPPVEVLCCRPKYWANIIHRYNDQNSLTSKCIENWALFERLTHSQRLALSVSPGAPGGVPNAKPSKASSFWSSSRMHNLLGSLPQLSARGTLYDNIVYDNWLRPKGLAKVSGILEGSDFNMKSIYERLRKGPKRKD